MNENCQDYDVTVSIKSRNGATKTFFITINNYPKKKMEGVEETLCRIGVEKMQENIFLKTGDTITIDSIKEIIDENQEGQ